MQLELAARDRQLEVGAQLALVDDGPLVGLFEGAGEPAALDLGAIEREVGLAEQRIGRGGMPGCEGDADAGGERGVLAVDLERGGQCLQQPPGERLRARRRRGVPHRKLVAAEPRYQGILGSRRLQAARCFLKHPVAGRMAETVVDGLETVEVEIEQSAPVAVLRRRLALAPDAGLEVRAVGEARQRIVVGEVGDAGLRVARRGDVGADPAIAGEGARRIRERLAGEPPPDGAARARRPDDEVAERLAVGHRPADRAGAVAPLLRWRDEDRLEKRALESGGVAAERRDERGSRPAQPAGGICLPDPAVRAGVLVEQERDHRLGLLGCAQVIGDGAFGGPLAPLQLDPEGGHDEENQRRQRGLGAASRREADGAGEGDRSAQAGAHGGQRSAQCDAGQGNRQRGEREGDPGIVGGDDRDERHRAERGADEGRERGRDDADGSRVPGRRPPRGECRQAGRGGDEREEMQQEIALRRRPEARRQHAGAHERHQRRGGRGRQRRLDLRRLDTGAERRWGRPVEDRPVRRGPGRHAAVVRHADDRASIEPAARVGGTTCQSLDAASGGGGRPAPKGLVVTEVLWEGFRQE